VRAVAYETTVLGSMPLVLRTQTSFRREAAPIPAHEFTPEALEAMRPITIRSDIRDVSIPRPDQVVSQTLDEGQSWGLGRFVILGGIVAGGLGLVGYFVWRWTRLPARNPGIRIEYDPLDDGLGDVYLGEALVGGVTNLAPPGRPKLWQPADERGMPLHGTYPTAERAADAAHQAWVAKQSRPAPAPQRPMEEPELLNLVLPEWVRDIEIENVRGAGNRYLVWSGDDRAGFIEGRGQSWDGYALVKGERRQIEIGTTRKRAVTSVYVAARVMAFLEQSCELGQGRPYAPRRFKRVASKVFGEAPRTVEEFQRTKYYNVMSDTEISMGTKIPIDEIRSIGRKLAEMGVLYGIVTRKSTETFTRVEKVEERRGQRKEPWGPPSPFLHRRTVISKPDIRKLRKSPVLTPEEKKKLPIVRSRHAYSFAIVGPRGAIGFYEAD